MPALEYACLECGKEFALPVSSREQGDEHITCPYCRSNMVERLVTTCEVVDSRKL